MQQLVTRLPAKFTKPLGLAMLFAAFYITAQLLMSFHTHTSLLNAEDDEPAHHQTECSVCLVANMASHSAEDIALVLPPSNLGTVYKSLSGDTWDGQSISPSHARAPPLA